MTLLAPCGKSLISFVSITPLTPRNWPIPLPSGRQTTVRSRVGWAKTYLVKAGLIEQPKRGLCLITARSKAALESGQTIDNHYLAQFGEFVAFTLASGESTGSLPAALPNAAEAQKPEQASPPKSRLSRRWPPSITPLPMTCWPRSWGFPLASSNSWWSI